LQGCLIQKGNHVKNNPEVSFTWNEKSNQEGKKPPYRPKRDGIDVNPTPNRRSKLEEKKETASYET